MFDPVGCGQDILQIATTHVKQVGMLELFAIAGGAAIVGRDHHVALVDHVLYHPIERVHSLRGGPTMDINNGRVLAAARHIVGHIHKGGDRPLGIAAGIVHQKRLDHVLGTDACYERIRYLLRLTICKGIYPNIVGRGRTIVIVEKA